MESQYTTEQIDRLIWAADNGFILKPNLEWWHTEEKFMFTHGLLLTAPQEEWDRLMDSFDYFTNNGGYR